MANDFLNSPDDIRLILLLMYKIIIIIGLLNCPAISPQRHTKKYAVNMLSV